MLTNLAVAANDTSRLAILLKPLVEIDRVAHARPLDMAYQPITRSSRESIEVNPSSSISVSTRLKAGMVTSLPTTARIVLVASYLASHNPSRLDTRYFSVAQNENGQKRYRSARKSSKISNRRSARLTGPKAFPIERLLALYDGLITYALEPNESHRFALMESEANTLSLVSFPSQCYRTTALTLGMPRFQLC